MIGVRRRHQRISSRKGFRLTEIFSGPVPAHARGYISKLEVSPLGDPVVTPQRKARPSTKAGGPRRSGACDDVPRNTLESHGRTEIRQRRTMSADGLDRSRWHTHSNAVSSTPLDSFVCRGAQRDAIDASAWPSFSPCSRPLPTELFSLDVPRRRALPKVQAMLLQQLGTLSCSHRQQARHPTVFALRTAVAVRALQANLRGHRSARESSGVPDRAENRTGKKSLAFGDGEVESTRDVTASSDSHGRRDFQMRMSSAWDTRPFSAPAFGPRVVDAKRRQGPSSTPGLDEPPVGRPLIEAPRPQQSRGTSTGGNAPPTFSAGPELPPATAQHNDHEVGNLKACLRSITAGVLLELGRLRNPPGPVQGVTAGIACVLGLRRWRMRHRHRRALFGNVRVLRNRLASVSPRTLPPQRISSLANHLGSSDLTPARVRAASAAATPVLKWLLAVIACAQAPGRSSLEASDTAIVY